MPCTRMLFSAGLYENYLNVKFKDPNLEAVCVIHVHVRNCVLRIRTCTHTCTHIQHERTPVLYTCTCVCLHEGAELACSSALCVVLCCTGIYCTRSFGVSRLGPSSHWKVTGLQLDALPGLCVCCVSLPLCCSLKTSCQVPSQQF